MELEFTDEQLELRDNVRGVLEGTCPRSLLRAVFEADDDADAQVAELWRQITELYWQGVAIPEDLGGLGLSYVELSIVAEELGRAVAPGPFLATVTQFAPLVQEVADAERRRPVPRPDRGRRTDRDRRLRGGRPLVGRRGAGAPAAGTAAPVTAGCCRAPSPPCSTGPPPTWWR